ncbi:hypothetical protein AVEN_221530-1 [Araneus ventricosus]|uniref:Uncharacterized protein n=1 Tax=Araneus ventricosus TaxID=182803 RepID=A0A4Y2PA37_ARAVE|nr:hypothetical protein AVEN_221530-1 [Araneus ventricosus]
MRYVIAIRPYAMLMYKPISLICHALCYEQYELLYMAMPYVSAIRTYNMPEVISHQFPYIMPYVIPPSALISCRRLYVISPYVMPYKLRRQPLLAQYIVHTPRR